MLRRISTLVGAASEAFRGLQSAGMKITIFGRSGLEGVWKAVASPSNYFRERGAKTEPTI
jgi:hypothetical protein